MALVAVLVRSARNFCDISVFSSLKIAHSESNTALNFDSTEFLFPNSKAFGIFTEICTDFRNLPAFADKYSSKLEV